MVNDTPQPYYFSNIASAASYIKNVVVEKYLKDNPNAKFKRLNNAWFLEDGMYFIRYMELKFYETS